MDTTQILEYSLSPADYQRSFDVCNHKQIRISRLCLIGVVVAIFAAFFMPELATMSIFLAAFMICLAIRNTKIINHQKTKLPIHSSALRWELYETDFAVSIYRDGVLSSYIRRKYTDILSAWRYDDRLTLLLDNALYILPAAAVPAESPLHAAIDRKLESQSRKTLLEKWGVGLFWGGIASVFVSAWTALALPDYFGGHPMAYMWMMWLALPVPCACLVVGFMLKKRGFPWKKQVICGILIAALLLLFGSYSFIFQPENEDAEAFLSRVEQETGLDLPCDGFSHLGYHVTTAPGNDRIFILGSYYSSLSGYEQRNLNHQLASDARWLREVPYGLLSCIPLNNINADADYFLLFDATTDTCNKIPTEPGVHTIFYLTYSSQYGYMEILEYEYICD